ncbi:phosphoglycerate mutase [Colletotrichum tabaci]|uniref:Phosphoglycerate mutase n=1 Tax=Colletotrichum tabaci TaxID=1209068 RepID=A0AAV9TQ08_9PEZI
MAAPPESPTSHVMQRSEQTERGFIKSCYDVRFFDPRVINFRKYKKTSPYVVARCLTPDADKCSWMPLFACFANIDGAITYARDGFFDKSCSACEYRAALGKMKCRCDRTTTADRLDLSAHVAALACTMGTIHLFLVRHGESVDNVAKLYAGSRDSPLTSHGVLQARRLGAHLASRTASASAGITHIFSSTLRRAYTTAAAVREAVAPSHHSSVARDIEVVRLSDLREKHFGTGEGQKFGGTTASGAARPRHDGAEDLDAMRMRAKRFVDGYLAPIFACVDAEPGGAAESIVIVAHGIILGVLSSVLCSPGLFVAVDPDSESQRPWSWSNTGFVEIRIMSMPVDPDLARASQDALPTVRWPRLSLQTVAVNCTEHLAGLKKTRGGIGSAKFDEKQKTIISFFAPASKRKN